MLRPLNGNVIIEPIEVEKKTASGIILTGDVPAETYAEGIVLAVGPGGLDYYSGTGGRHEIPVEVGQKVLYMSYGDRASLTYDGKNLIILEQGEILAVVEESK